MFNVFNVSWVLGHVHKMPNCTFNISRVMLKVRCGQFNMTGVLGYCDQVM